MHAVLSVEQTKKPLLLFFREKEFLVQESRARAQARRGHSRAAVWLGVCCVAVRIPPGPRNSLAARLAQPNLFKKKHCVSD